MFEKSCFLHPAIGGRVPYAATEATIGTFATVGTYRSFAQRTTQIRIVAGATIRALFARGAIYLVRVTVTPQKRGIVKQALTVRTPGSTVVTLTTNHANPIRMSTLRTHRLLHTICGRGGSRGRIGGGCGHAALRHARCSRHCGGGQRGAGGGVGRGIAIPLAKEMIFLIGKALIGGVCPTACVGT